jgi:hypothetical protein
MRVWRREQITGHAAQVVHAHLLVNVFAVDVPEHERDFLTAGLDDFLIDLHADGGVVFLVENAFNETADETGFPDRERSQHADFFLKHASRSL